MLLFLFLISVISSFSLSRLNYNDVKYCKTIFNDNSMQTDRTLMLKYKKTDNKCCSLELENNKIVKKCRTI